jgi:signal peptidase I
MNLFSKQPPHDNTDSDLVLPESDQPITIETEKENTFTELLRFSVIALLIVVPIRMFVAQPFIVSGASMQETFQSGEYLIVDQVTYYFEKPSRGDVVIFRYPKDPSKYFIKRIIGIPGDNLTIENDVVTITNTTYPEGLVLNEPYVKSMRGNINLEETLGEREYFVMGDNRDESSDSRVWGVLPEERIVGRALLRLLPPSQAGLFPGSFNEEIISQSRN